MIEQLSSNEKRVISLIPENGIFYQEFYRLYRKIYPSGVKDRMLRYYLERLARYGLISMERERGWRRLFYKAECAEENYSGFMKALRMMFIISSFLHTVIKKSCKRKLYNLPHITVMMYVTGNYRENPHVNQKLSAYMV